MGQFVRQLQQLQVLHPISWLRSVVLPLHIALIAQIFYPFLGGELLLIGSKT